MSIIYEEGFEKYPAEVLKDWFGDLSPSGRCILPPTYMREAIAALDKPLEIKGLHFDPAVYLSTDYAALEQRVMAIAASHGMAVIIIDSMRKASAREPHYNGIKADFIVIDEFYDMPEPEQLELQDKPLKQNGRSASYLQHDRTKQHKRRKR